MERFTNILVVVDTNRSGTSALRQAVSIARKNEATLIVASILEDISGEPWMNVLSVSSAKVRDIAKAEELNRLTEYTEAFESGEAPLEKRVLIGRASAEIIRQVLSSSHNLLVKDVEISDGLLEVFLGSTDMQLLRKCPCPVLISWPGCESYRRILACVDYGPGDTQNEAINRKIIEIASSLARFQSGELHVVHAIEPFGEKFLRAAYIASRGMNLEELTETEQRTRNAWLDELLEEALATAKVDEEQSLVTKRHLIKGQARDVVPIKAQELKADLIILGTLSRTGVPGYFIGNTSENILNQVRCSVLTLKPDEFVSPVTL